MNKPKIVVSSFKPYPFSGGRNVTEAIPHQLAEAFPDSTIVPLALKASYDSHLDIKREFLGGDPPDAVIMLGETASKKVKIELLANNYTFSSMPDAGFKYRFGRVIKGKDAPRHIESSLPYHSINDQLNLAGYDSELSYSAGRYVINHTYFHILNKIQRERLNTLAGFINIPENLKVGSDAEIIGRIAVNQTLRALKQESNQ